MISQMLDCGTIFVSARLPELSISRLNLLNTIIFYCKFHLNIIHSSVMHCDLAIVITNQTGMELNHFPTDRIASHCAEESSKKQQTGRDDRICFELLHRAFELGDHVVLGYALNIYKDVWSRFWVRDAHTFENKHLTVDDYKIIASMSVFQVMLSRVSHL